MLLRAIVFLLLFVNVVLWLLYFMASIQLSSLLIIHVLTASAVAILSQQLLPARYASPRLGGVIFLALLCVCLPVLGLFGVCFSIVPSLQREPEIQEQLSLHTALPPLPYKPIALQSNNYSSGGIYETLKHADDSEQRSVAVMATQDMQTRMAVPLLRLALRDPDDDVRLLAYGILDKKENQVNAIINALLAASSDKDNDRAAEIKQQLAHQYWEMAYLGLAEGDVRLNMLEKAEALLRAVIDDGRHSEASAYLLLGRVQLAMEKPLDARRALQGARLLGVGDSVLAPYMAEIAFMQGDYVQVKKYLEPLDVTDNRSMSNVLHYWSEVHA